MAEKAAEQDWDHLLADLLVLAERLDVRVRREALGDEETEVNSGLATVEGRPVLFLDSRIDSREAVEVLLRELRVFHLDDVYLRPALRRLLRPDSED
jgi:hypothetical protein